MRDRVRELRSPELGIFQEHENRTLPGLNCKQVQARFLNGVKYRKRVCSGSFSSYNTIHIPSVRELDARRGRYRLSKRKLNTCEDRRRLCGGARNVSNTTTTTIIGLPIIQGDTRVTGHVPKISMSDLYRPTSNGTSSAPPSHLTQLVGKVRRSPCNLVAH